MIKFNTFIFTVFLGVLAFGQTNSPYFSTGAVTFNSTSAEIGLYKNAGNNALVLVSGREWGIVKRVDAKEAHFFNYFEVNATDNKVGGFQRTSNSKFNEGPMCFTPDGKRVYFTRNAKKKNKSTQKYELNLCSAAVDAKGKWSKVSETNVSNPNYSVGHPAVSNDGKYLVFASEMPGGKGGTDLYISEINGDGSLGTPLNLGEKVNTSGQELFPWFSPEGQLFFSSNGLKGFGGFDLWVTEIKKWKRRIRAHEP